MGIPTYKKWTSFLSTELSGFTGYYLNHGGAKLWIEPVAKNGKILYRASTTQKGGWHIHDFFNTPSKACKFFQDKHK